MLFAIQRLQLPWDVLFSTLAAFLFPYPPSVITAMIAATSVSVNLYGGLLTERKRADLAKQMERERQAAQQLCEMRSLVARYRGPLLEAAVDLESRLVAVATGRTARGGGRGVVEEEVVYTLFTLAQFLGFVELVRREGPRERSFLQQGNPQGTDTLANLLEGFRFILCGHPQALQAWYDEGEARDHPGSRRRPGVPYGGILRWPVQELEVCAPSGGSGASGGCATSGSGEAGAGGSSSGAGSGAADSNGRGSGGVPAGKEAACSNGVGSGSSCTNGDSSSSSNNNGNDHGSVSNASSNGRGSGMSLGGAALGQRIAEQEACGRHPASASSCGCNDSPSCSNGRTSKYDNGNGNNTIGNGKGLACDRGSIAHSGGDATTSSSSNTNTNSSSNSSSLHGRNGGSSSSGRLGGRFNSSKWPGGNVLHMSRGTQRAVGSFMIITPVGAPRHYTLSYSDFYWHFYRDPAFAAWLRPIFEDLVGLIATPGGWPGVGPFPVNRWTRLLLLQQLLVDTIDLLDPFMVRTSEQHRWRLAPVQYAPLPNAESYKERLRVLESMADTALPVMNSVFLRTGWARDARDKNEYLRNPASSSSSSGGGSGSGSGAGLPGQQLSSSLSSATATVDPEFFYLYSSVSGSGGVGGGGGGGAGVTGRRSSVYGLDDGGGGSVYNSLDEIDDDGNGIPPYSYDGGGGGLGGFPVLAPAGPMGRSSRALSGLRTPPATAPSQAVVSTAHSLAFASSGNGNGNRNGKGHASWDAHVSSADGYWRAAEDDESIPPPTALIVPGSSQQR
ncbi:hypothetical protein Agub_g114 [Astrephomene gubernaculifera]|uniref:Uncharacterized protein n=1 Tax=Astrephomene gubernaculifera TaxID=47775 RepID=A0AAD3HGD3_9CHLO|nr:hypothetical protein Agub_g114 [Astrephomene gubernaculifera]